MKLNSIRIENKIGRIVLASLVAALIATFLFIFLQHPKNPKISKPASELPDYSGITVNDVIKFVAKHGHGKRLEAGDRVTLRYRMWIYDPAALGNHGKSVAAESEHEVTVVVGHHDIITGWDNALSSMRLGEQATLIIPPKLAYGDAGVPTKVPPGAIIQVTTTALRSEK